MKTIEDLPDEILLIILSKLNLWNITRVGGTCRRWRNLSVDVKTIHYIAKRGFDCKKWVEKDFHPQQEDIYHAKILGTLPLKGMNGKKCNQTFFFILYFNHPIPSNRKV